jgi:hypothetical protein
MNALWQDKLFSEAPCVHQMGGCSVGQWGPANRSCYVLHNKYRQTDLDESPCKCNGRETRTSYDECLTGVTWRYNGRYTVNPQAGLTLMFTLFFGNLIHFLQVYI